MTLADDSFDDLAARAKTAQESSDPNAAIPLYNAALKIKPDWKEGLWLAGSLLYGADRYAEAIPYLSRLTGLAGRAAESWALLGLCEYETRNFSSSLEHIQHAISIGIPNQPQMMLVLAFHEAALLTKLGRFDESTQKYSVFFDIRVSDQQVLIGLGLLSMRRLIAPVEVSPADRELYVSAGSAFAAMLADDQPGAHRLYEELAARFPSDANVHYAYGYFLFGTDGDAAISQWNRALAIDPTNLGANAMLAWAFLQRGDEAVASVHAKAALAKNPDEVVPQLVLGRVLVDSGHLQDGLLHIEKAVRLQPENIEANLALAGAYSEAGRTSDAQRERLRCMEIQAEKRHAQQH